MIKNITTKSNFTLMPGKSFIYDETNGAIMYIITVIICYSMGMALMLGMQTLSNSEDSEDAIKRRTKFIMRNINDHDKTKAILEELVDQGNRDRLWDIYLGGTWNNKKGSLNGAENVRIRNLKKQLDSMKRNHRLTLDSLYCTNHHGTYIRSYSWNRPNRSQSLAKMNSCTRRRSSFDQQDLERLRELANQSKLYAQLPWAIRKLIIRR